MGVILGGRGISSTGVTLGGGFGITVRKGGTPPSSSPTVVSTSPSFLGQGKTGNITIVGTNFTGATAVSFGTGVTVNSFIVDAVDQITANITIGSTASVGVRTVSVTTPAGVGELVGGFEVEFNPISLGWNVYYSAESVIQSGGLVSQINDLSGNGNHATQSNGSLQADYIAANSLFNNKPTFTCVNTDVYSLTSNISIGRNVNRIQVYVFRAVTNSTIGIFDTETFSYLDLRRNNGMTFRFVGNGSLWLESGTPVISNASSFILINVFEQNDFVLSYLNGGAVFTQSTAVQSGSGSFNANRIFGSKDGSAMNFEIAEYAHLEGATLTTSQLNQLGAYLGAKYNITWNNI
jgi:hypothetical protein